MKIKKIGMLLTLLGVLVIAGSAQGAIALLDEFNGPAGPATPDVNEWNGNVAIDGSGNAVFPLDTPSSLASRFYTFFPFDIKYQPMSYTVTSQSSPHGFMGLDARSPFIGSILVRPDLGWLMSRGPGGFDFVSFDSKSLTGPYTVDITWTPTLVEIIIDGFVEYSTTNPDFIPTDFLAAQFQTYDGGVGKPPGSMLLDRVQVGIGLPGDFNNDDSVDGADFLAWQRDLVDAPNLALWEANYGATAAVQALAAQSAVAAVPEPATLSIMALGLLALVLKGRRRR